MRSLKCIFPALLLCGFISEAGMASAAPATEARMVWAPPLEFPAAAKLSKDVATRVRIELDDTGRMTSCAVVGTSGKGAFDKATCSWASKARFEAARSEAGLPHQSVWDGWVNWYLPRSAEDQQDNEQNRSNRVGSPTSGVFQTANDYPSRALREGRSGRAVFSVLVGEDGRARSCWIVATSNQPDLDEATCRSVLLRARFNPSRNVYNEIEQSTYTSSMNWIAPQGGF